MNSIDIILLKANGSNLFSHLLYDIIPQSFLVDAATFFSIIIVSVIVVILFYLFWRARRIQRKDTFKRNFNDLISEVAICETEAELNEVILQPAYQKILLQYQQSPVDRNFMINELSETCKKFSGATMANIHWLFQKTQLKKDLLLHLNSKHWYIKAKAVQQLGYLQQKDQLPNIFRLANHNNDLVRMEAQVATVKLIGFEGLRFLNVISYPISEWQQLRLIHELSGHSIKNFNNVDNWLRSSNESVIEFALRLVEIYQRYEFHDDVAQCLYHPAASIRRQAVVAISKISNEKTVSTLINYYPDSDSSIQLLILKMLQVIGTENEVTFLVSQLNHTSDSFKLEAAKAIQKVSDTGIEKIEELIDNTVEPWNIILPQLKTGSIV